MLGAAWRLPRGKTGKPLETMVSTVVKILGGFIVAFISGSGYIGITLLMAIESACIPLPSEVIMPFSGYLVSAGHFSLWGVAVAGALGCNIGSIVAYFVGAVGGRPLAERYGRYVLITRHDLEMADRFFARYGDWAVFIARLLPVVRTFIALPAGISRMNFARFNIYTFLGSLPWCFALAYAGMKLGERWETLGPYFHHFDTVFLIVIVVGAIWFIRNRWKNRLPAS
jgi:membrane protein DedA with SNARE-associated domain